jgi:hypothetical protein
MLFWRYDNMKVTSCGSSDVSALLTDHYVEMFLVTVLEWPEENNIMSYTLSFRGGEESGGFGVNKLGSWHILATESK